MKKQIWNNLKNYKFNSIFFKTFILIMILSVVPIGGVSILAFNINNNLTKTEIQNANKHSLSKTADLFDMILSEVENLSIMISTDQRVQHFLLYESEDQYDYNAILLRKDIIEMVSTANSISEYIDSIYIYSNSNKYIISTEGTGDLNNFPEMRWYEIYNKNDFSKKFWVQNIYDNGAYYLSYFRVPNILGNTTRGVIVINISFDILSQMISNDNGGDESIYIVDNAGIILYCKNKDLVNSNINDLLTGSEVESLYNDSTFSLSGNYGKIITTTTSIVSDWKYISIVPLNQYKENLDKLKNLMVLLIILSVLSVIFLSLIIASKTYRPIKEIISLIENRTDKNYMVLEEPKRSLDEIKYIANNITRTYNENIKMEDELAKRLELLKKAQTVALQSQINPHFLYNTLETINWKVMGLTGSKNEAASMIKSLSQLLRISLETENDLIPFSEELEHVRLYVEILKYRYKDKISVIWDIDESIIQYKIVKLTLQPLIENAVYHGIKKTNRNGVIQISVHMTNDNILIAIKDNGEGMAKDKLKAIQKELSSNRIKENEHIGLNNIHQRLALMFGAEYGIRIKSEPNEGTEVTIVIPKVK